MQVTGELPTPTSEATPVRQDLTTPPGEPAPAAATWTLEAPGAPSADRRSEAGRDLRRVAAAGIVLAVVATLFAVQQARDFLLPVVLAVLLAGVLKPLVQALTRRGWPAGLAAATTILATVTAVALAAYELIGPAASWLVRVPAAMARLEPKLRGLQALVARVAELANRVAAFARVSGSSPVEVQADAPLWDLVGAGRHVAMEAVIAAVLLYFILAAGEGLLERLLAVLPASVDRRRARECVGDVERQISTYLFTVTSINFCLGAAVSFTLWLVGVPNPVLWGVLMATLNFVPYVGAPLAIGTIAFVSFLSFDAPLRILAAPLASLALSAVETYLVTPMVVGRSLSVSPAAVFVSLTFWTWLWGLPGALIAVPMLMALRIIVDAVPGLAPWGRLVAAREHGLSPRAAPSEPRSAA